MAGCDAVVVGAGHNGLVAANLLVDAGWSVVVLEEQDEPGGAVRTAALTAPGFANDVCSSFYPFVAGPSPIRSLRLEQFGLQWSHAPTVLTHLTPEGIGATLSTDPPATEASVRRFAAGDAARWRDAYRDWLQVEQGVLTSLFTPFPPVRPVIGLVRRAGVAGVMRLARRLLLPAVRSGRELFDGQGARLLIDGLALHADVALSAGGSGGYGLLLAMLGQHYGFPVPRGGAGALTAALTRRLRQRGGELLCRASVTHIDVLGGTARGVHTADGRVFLARRAVLANVDAARLYRRLLAPSVLPDRILADLLAFDHGPSTVKVDWALSTPVPWRDPQASGSGTVHIGSAGGMLRYSAALAAGEMPERPFLICGQMTTADPTRSPAGTESFWAYTHLPHRMDWSANQVAEVVARMEEVIEATAPGFADRVLARHIAGPAQLQEENANLVAGALAGGTNAMHQQLFLRPVPGLGRADTPIDRLYLASASAHPGGGVHGGPGANAARAALVRDRVATGLLYRRAVAYAQRRIYPS
ncbi:MAG TPA: NAD(P)/FAD-dependent oxidoreductase [Micromonosporaceae bacterium]